ncbi:hypothetical protein AN958_07991 [Leucoagaricus sp. SymC.cos]|nr:hypothetical protein AN958_07991 [Leucoagaricus sp. SymC.cos]
MQLPTKFISSITLAATLASASIFPRQAEPGNYTLTFTNQTGAVQGTDFITFGLFETTDECTAFCDSVSTCGFANSYNDNNGKGGSPLLTCSLYVGCHDVADLTNTGGQTQPDGTVNFITNSDGWCKATDTTDPTNPTDPTDPTDPTTDPTDPTTGGTGA